MRILKPTLIFTVLATAATAQTAEPHLNIIPRTADEIARIASVTAPTTDFTKAEAFEVNAAGAATSLKTINSNAFSHFSPNMDFADELDFKVGNGFFRKLWASSPSSTLASDGLGPLFNTRSCQRCHLKDGRGHTPDGPDDNAVSMFLRISIPGNPGDGIAEIEGYLATLPDPNYGSQLQEFAVVGHAGEYTLGITYEEIEIELSDGEVASLRAPTYTAENLGYGPLHPDAMLSPRVTPPMTGLGLLETVPAADILANADPYDDDGDGISGRPNIVWSSEFQQPMLGRFGLKAGAPSIVEQSANAFAGDIGISSPLNPNGWGECTENQTTCREAPHGGTPEAPEISQEAFDLVVFYSRNLAVPARRNVDDPEVLRGKQVFYETGCTACHNPKFVTHRLTDRDEQSFQLIWPYTDMLLHDMGEGLADHRPEARADGYEWRTSPLWGIGLTEVVNGHTEFLHDGRARNFLEAILWHGGEAQAARDTVVSLPSEDRAALIKFLESL